MWLILSAVTSWVWLGRVDYVCAVVRRVRANVGHGSASAPNQTERRSQASLCWPKGLAARYPQTLPLIATPTLVVWETEDAFRAAVQVPGQDGLAGVWGAAEQPKRWEVLKVQPHDGFLLTREERYDRAALVRCVRMATQERLPHPAVRPGRST
jgi:hypothetical protein